MNPADRGEFARLLTDALAFYGKDVSRFALDVWWQACQPFTLDQVSRALTRHAMDAERGQFAPKPADLVRQLVAPFTGAWIETVHRHHHWIALRVAPFTGAWIETPSVRSARRTSSGRALHGRVD